MNDPAFLEMSRGGDYEGRFFRNYFFFFYFLFFVFIFFSFEGDRVKEPGLFYNSIGVRVDEE
jgi:hypothetical protein